MAVDIGLVVQQLREQRARWRESQQRLRDPGDLSLAQPGVKRKRERAFCAVLADRELALAMAEALPVERHQVDRREVGLARHRSWPARGSCAPPP